MNDILPSIKTAVMRGTTPTLLFDIGFDVSELTAFELYFMQGNKRMFTKDKSDCMYLESEVSVMLSQADTYKLSSKKRLEVRCRFKRNNSPIVGTLTKVYDVLDIGKPEEILDTLGYPTHIRIFQEPTKLNYINGETLDYSGIVVKAYRQDGELFRNQDYPDGIIQFSELLFPIQTATAGSRLRVVANGVEFSDNGDPIIENPDLAGGYIRFYFGETKTYGDIEVHLNGRDLLSGQNWSLLFPNGRSHRTPEGAYHRSPWYFRLHCVMVNGEPRIYVQDKRTSRQGDLRDGRNDDFTEWFDMSWTSTPAIPVQWICPYTAFTMEDTFDITVTSE